MKRRSTIFAVSLLLMIVFAAPCFAQITPSDDTYTLTSSPKSNFGAKNILVWANAHRIPVEEVKNDQERGSYLHPELSGAPEEKSVTWVRHPDLMRRQKTLREKRSEASQPGPRNDSPLPAGKVSQ